MRTRRTVNLITISIVILLPLIFINGYKSNANQVNIENDFEIVAKLVDIHERAGCGVIHYGGIAEYTDIRVLKGKYSQQKVYVIHGCTEIKRTNYVKGSGNLESFQIGDYHKLNLTLQNIYRIESVNFNKFPLIINKEKYCSQDNKSGEIYCTIEQIVRSQEGLMYFCRKVDLFNN
jgi:hypothetical protein